MNGYLIALIISLIGLLAALVIDFVNLTMLIRLRRWSQGAVDEIIGTASSEIIKRLNLQVGKSGTTAEKLATKFEEVLEKSNEEVPTDLRKLNLPMLFAKIQSGGLDFKDFIPIAVKLMGRSGNTGESSGQSGQWK